MGVGGWAAVAAGVLVLSVGGAAHAAPGDDLVAASTALKAKIEAAGLSGKAPPTLADDGAEIRGAYSLEALAATPDDLGGLLNVCGAAYGPEESYLTFGRAKGESDRVVASRDEVRFQNEMAVGFRFEMACFSRVGPLIQAFVTHLAPADWNQARRDGLAQMRKGLTETFTGVVIIATDPISTVNRETILTAAASAAPSLVALMPLGEREALRVRVDQALAAPGLSAALKGDLAAIRTALQSSECIAACAM